MIVKKPWRRVICQMWNKKTQKFELIFTKDYIGYFLFGFIPIYLIKIRETIGDDENDYENYVSNYRDLLIR